MQTSQFRDTVWDFYKSQARTDLPWRKTTNPYRILVSEIMLQQTQVERVIPFYKEWTKKFPSARALADASLSDVLKVWQGLGYNRRAKALHEAGKALAGRPFPRTREELEKLPGIGSYTAGAVLAFAYNEEVVMVETNIRTVITHHYFSKRGNVTDEEIRLILIKTLPNGKSREWYWALMDYGSYLKKNGIQLNSKKKGYTKQKTFEGSNRQARGVIVKCLTHKSATLHTLTNMLPKRVEQLAEAVKELLAEGIIEKKGTHYQLPT